MTETRSEDDTVFERWILEFLGRAGIGAGVTVLVSVLPVVGLIAPAIGGGVASWTDPNTADRGAKIGAAAGGLVTLFSLPLTFVAVAVASTVSPAATVGVLALTLVGAAYVVGSSALGGYLADRVSAGEKLPWSTDDPTVSEAPIERLKHQYVDGELTDAEFERRLERLVDADRERERVEAGPDHGQQSRYRSTDHERESIDRKR